MTATVAVVGAGVMGHGIALLLARAGREVRLVEPDAAQLDSALAAVRDELELLAEEGLCERGEVPAALARIRPAQGLEEAVARAGAVFEAIPELLEAKWELFDRIDRAAPARALVASTTSTFPVARLAERSLHPERMLVAHFFNPAHLVPLVEVVPHPATPPARAEAALALLRALGKRPILVRREVPGFVANRLQAAMLREALALVAAGVASPEDVDSAITEGPGFRWPFVGHIETADLGGLDVWKRVLDNLLPLLDRSEAAPPAIADRVARGELGAKRGGGIRTPAGPAAARLRQRDRMLARLLRLRSG